MSYNPERLLPPLKCCSLPSPHPLCCDSSSDSETDSLFDSVPGDDYSYNCYSGYLPRLKLAAIPPVVATESATGNFLAAATADKLLLDIIEQDSQRAPLQAAAANPGPVDTVSTDVVPRMAADANKCREVRVNSDFLRRYALDCSARLHAVLPLSDDMDEVAMLTRKPELKRFDARYGLARVSALSKEKLWHSVVLEPRTDARPLKCIVAQDGNANAAAPLRMLQLPAGVLWSARHMHHSSDWCTISTFTQYTRKGWSSERWSVK